MSHASTSMSMPDYAQAVQQIEAIIESERPLISEWGATRLLTHGRRVRNALVLFHGFTNCPRQCVALGERFFDLGYNVLIPRLPYHGLADRMTRDLKHLKAEELYLVAETAANLIHGLGEHVAIAGLSLGGLMTARLALRCADLDVAVPVAPDFGVPFIPGWLTRPAVALMRMLPDFYMWWDPRTKADNPESYPFAYPGFPSRAAAEVLEMGRQVRDEAIEGKPLARRVLFVTIGGDPAVSNRETERIARLWKTRAPGAVSTYEFDRAYGFPHDIITPESPRTRVDVVYSKLVELVTGLVDAI